MVNNGILILDTEAKYRRSKLCTTTTRRDHGKMNFVTSSLSHISHAQFQSFHSILRADALACTRANALVSSINECEIGVIAE